MDQKRHQITKLYSEDAVLVYEGNKIKSSKEIGDFYGKMPSSSHRVTTLDAQPISQKMLNGINSVLVSGKDSFLSNVFILKTVSIKSLIENRIKMNFSKASGTVKWNASGGGQPQVKSFTQENL